MFESHRVETETFAGPPTSAPGESALNHPDHVASTKLRMLAAIGGAGALLLGSVLSIGLGIVAIAGIGSAALVQRVRRRRLTRVGSLVGSVLAVVVVVGGLIAFAVSRAPDNVFEQSQ